MTYTFPTLQSSSTDDESGSHDSFPSHADQKLTTSLTFTTSSPSFLSDQQPALQSALSSQPPSPIPFAVPGLLKPLKSSPLSNPPLFSPSREPSPAPRASPTRSRSPTTTTLTFNSPPQIRRSNGQTPTIPVPISNPRATYINHLHLHPQRSSSVSSSPPLFNASSSSPKLYTSRIVSTPNPTPVQLALSSNSPPSSSPPLSRSQPLLGSYPLSLLHSRMSAHATHTSLPSRDGGFTLLLSVHGKGKGRICPPKLRCPKPLELELDARYYDLESTSQTPWVATVDLEAHYFSLYSHNEDSQTNSCSSYPQPKPRSTPSTIIGEFTSPQPHSSSFVPTPASPSSPSPSTRTRSKPRSCIQHPPPCYPGYQVPPWGQLQILIRSPTRAIKVFIIPYDLRHLPPGGRMLLRERTYVQPSQGPPSTAVDGTGSPSSSLSNSHSTSPSPSLSNSKLRHAVQLQFICVKDDVEDEDDIETEEDQSEESKARCSAPEKSYYISRALRLVFTSFPTEPDDLVHTERTEDMVPPSSSSPGTGSGTVGYGSPTPSSKSISKRRLSVLEAPSFGSRPMDSPQSQLAFSPGSLERRAEQWARVRARYISSKSKNPTPQPDHSIAAHSLPSHHRSSITSSHSWNSTLSSRLSQSPTPPTPTESLSPIIIQPPDFRPVRISSPASPSLQPSLLSTLDPRDSSTGAAPTGSLRGMRSLVLPRPPSPIAGGKGAGGLGNPFAGVDSVNVGRSVNGGNVGTSANGTHVGSPASRRMRRGSVEERELSERLRSLGIKTAR